MPVIKKNVLKPMFSTRMVPIRLPIIPANADVAATMVWAVDINSFGASVNTYLALLAMKKPLAIPENVVAARIVANDPAYLYRMDWIA